MLDTANHPLKAEAVGQGVWKSPVNVKSSNPRRADLNGGVLNSCDQESSKKAQCPFVSWAWGAQGMKLTKLSAE